MASPWLRFAFIACLSTPLAGWAQSATATITEVDAIQSANTVCSVTSNSGYCSAAGAPVVTLLGYNYYQLRVTYSVSGLAQGSQFAIKYAAIAESSTATSQTVTTNDDLGEPVSQSSLSPLQAGSAQGGAAVTGVVTIDTGAIETFQVFQPPVSCNGLQYVERVPLQIVLCTNAQCTTNQPINTTAGSIDHIDLLFTNAPLPSAQDSLTILSAVQDANDGGYDVTIGYQNTTSLGDWGETYVPGDLTSSMVFSYQDSLADGGLVDAGFASITSVVPAANADQPFLFADGYRLTQQLDGYLYTTVPAVQSAEINTYVGASQSYYSWTDGGSSLTYQIHHHIRDGNSGPDVDIALHVPPGASKLLLNTTLASSNVSADGPGCGTVVASSAHTSISFAPQAVSYELSHIPNSSVGYSNQDDNPDAGTGYFDGGYDFTAAQEPAYERLVVTPVSGGSFLNPTVTFVLAPGITLAELTLITSAPWTITAYPFGQVMSQNGVNVLQCCDGTTCGPGAVGTPIAAGAWAALGVDQECFTVSASGLAGGSTYFDFYFRPDTNLVANAGLTNPFFQGTNQMQFSSANLASYGTGASYVQPAYLAAGVGPVLSDTYDFEYREGIYPLCTNTAIANAQHGSAFYYTEEDYSNTTSANGTKVVPMSIDIVGTNWTNEHANLANGLVSEFSDPAFDLVFPPQLSSSVPVLVGHGADGGSINEPCVPGAPPADGGTTYHCSVTGRFLVPEAFVQGPSPLAASFNITARAGGQGDVFPIGFMNATIAQQGSLPVLYGVSLNKAAYNNADICPVTIVGANKNVLTQSTSVDAGVTVLASSPYSYDLVLSSTQDVGSDGTTVIDMFGLDPTGAPIAGIDGGCLSTAQILTAYPSFVAQADGGSTTGAIYFSLDGGSAPVGYQDGGPWVPMSQVPPSQLSQVRGVEVVVTDFTGVPGSFAPTDPPMDLHLQFAVPAVTGKGQLCNEPGVATQGQGVTASTPIAFSVEPDLLLGNPCPASLPLCTAPEGSTTQTFLANESSAGDAVTFHCSGLPVWASLNSSTGEIDWTPPYLASLAPDYEAHCWISDGNGLNDEDGTDPLGDDCPAADGNPADNSGHCGQNVEVMVTRTDVAPIFAPNASGSVPENATISFQVSASDPNCDTFALSSSHLPPGMSCSFDAGSYDGGTVDGGQVSCRLATASCDWTPDYTQAGQWTADFSATEANGTAGGPLSSAQSVPIAVINVDRPPFLAPIAAQCVVAGSMLSFIVDGGDPDLAGTGYLGLNGTNAYSDSVVYSAGLLPVGASFDAGTREFSWTPTNDQAGDHIASFSIVDHDGPLDAGEQVSIHVDYLSLPPVISDGGYNTIEGATLTFATPVTDPEGNLDHCTMSNLPAGASYDPLGQQFSWSPGPGAAGKSPYVVTTECCSTPPASAPAALCSTAACESMNTVIEVARVASPLQLTVSGGQSTPEAATVQLLVSASDYDCSSFTLSAAGLPAGMTCTLDGGAGACAGQSLSCRWTPGYTQAGPWTFAVSAQEAATGAVPPANAALTIPVSVSNVDRAPTLDAIPAQVTIEESPLEFEIDGGDADIPLTGYQGLNGADPYSDSIVYSALQVPAGATFDPQSLAFSWTPALGQWGDVAVPFQVVDHDGPLSAEQTADIHVQYKNIAPLLSPNPVEQGTEGSPISFSTPVLDPRGNPDSCSMTDLPDGATFDPVSRQFNWTPGAGAANAGPYTVTIECCSIPPAGADPVPAQACSSMPTQIVVGTWIQLQPVPPISTTVGNTIGFPVVATDPSGAPISCTLTPLPAGAVFDPSTDRFSWTPAAAGNYPLTLRCSDGERTASEPVQITVAAGNSDRVGGGLATMSCAQSGGAEWLAMLSGLLAMSAVRRRSSRRL